MLLKPEAALLNGAADNLALNSSSRCCVVVRGAALYRPLFPAWSQQAITFTTLLRATDFLCISQAQNFWFYLGALQI